MRGTQRTETRSQNYHLKRRYSSSLTPIRTDRSSPSNPNVTQSRFPPAPGVLIQTKERNVTSPLLTSPSITYSLTAPVLPAPRRKHWQRKNREANKETRAANTAGDTTGKWRGGEWGRRRVKLNLARAIFPAYLGIPIEIAVESRFSARYHGSTDWNLVLMHPSAPSVGPFIDLISLTGSRNRDKREYFLAFQPRKGRISRCVLAAQCDGTNH